MARTSTLGGSGSFPNGVGTPKSNSILMASMPGLSLVGGSAAITDLLVAVPFVVPAVTIIDGLVCENTNTTDNTETLRLGIYATTTGGVPGALLGQTGVITLDATADVRVAALSGGAITLLPSEMYWLAINGASSVDLLGYSATTSILADPFMGRVGVPSWNAGFGILSATYRYGLQASHTFGSLPDPFPTPTNGPARTIALGVQVQ